MNVVFLALSVIFPIMLSGAAPTCESLGALALPNTTITIAESRPPGEFSAPDAKPIPNLPAFCRIAGSIKPSSDSDIQFEVWLPSSNWNGKFQGIGNGGFAGAINWAGLADAVRNGYATASTDTGHRDGGSPRNGPSTIPKRSSISAIARFTKRPPAPKPSSAPFMVKRRNGHTSTLARTAAGRP